MFLWTTSPLPNDDVYCITYTNSAITGWTSNKWWCGRDDKSKLPWVSTATPGTQDCFRPFDTTDTLAKWPNSICLPAVSPYTFSWVQATTAPAGYSCTAWTVSGTTNWATAKHWLCCPNNTPYPNGETALAYHYAAPTVTNVVPNNGPLSGGTTLTITGTSFGTSGSVTINGISCPITDTSSYTHTTMKCMLPAGSGAYSLLIVTVSSQTSSPWIFSYDPPALDSTTPLVPTSGPTAGSFVVTINGQNFGASTGTVTIGGISCPVVGGSWSNTQVQCTVAAGQGTGLSVIVTTPAAQSNPANTLFRYSPPVLTFMTPTSSETIAGPVLKLNGTSLGTVGSISVGGNDCPITGLGWSHSYVQCLLPAGQGRNQSVIATVSGQTSTPLYFNYDAPYITSITPSGGQSGVGLQITLVGTSFGTSGAEYVAGVLCTEASGAHQHRRVVCSIPTGQGLNRPVYMNVSGQGSNVVFFNYAPTVTGAIMLGDGKAPTAGGGTVQISGVGFNVPAVAVATVTINGLSCPVLSQVDTVITCTLPPGMYMCLYVHVCLMINWMMY
jgi:hypothetical protein